MKILLVQPDVSKRAVGFTSLVRPEPLALEIVAASVPRHEVVILDLRVDPTPLVNVLESFRPQIVGITGYTTDVPRMLEICSEVKAFDPAIVMVAGGHHVTVVPEDFDTAAVDFLVLGEGETTFPELIACLDARDSVDKVAGIRYRYEGRPVETMRRPLAKDLDALPLPARHLTNHYRKDYHFHFWDNPYMVETARGCPFRCSFCSVWVFNRGRYRTHRPERVIEDLKRMNTDTVCFVDDIFMETPSYSQRLAELIKREGLHMRYWSQLRSDNIVKRPHLIEQWAQVGLHTALVGFEKFRQDELDDVNKHNTVENNEIAMDILHQHDVDMWGAFIIDPKYVKEDFDALIEYVRSKHITFPQFTIITPLPGTQFFKDKFDELITRNYEVFDLLHTVLPTKLPIEEFYENMARLYASTTMGWGELKRRIRAGTIPRSALERIRGLLADVTDPKMYLRQLEAVK